MDISIKTICCIGAGYVGGPTMTMMASKCPDLIFNVVDINEKELAHGIMKTSRNCQFSNLV